MTFNRPNGLIDVVKFEGSFFKDGVFKESKSDITFDASVTINCLLIELEYSRLVVTWLLS